MGQLAGRGRRGRPDREDLRAALRPLQLDAARVRRRARRVQPRHRAVDDPLQQPVPGLRRDHDGARDPLRDRQAPLRHPGHRRRLRQQDHLAPAARRVLPARAQAEPRDPVDRVAHRVPPLDVARQRALVPRHRGRGQGRRHAARLPHEGARRRRRVHALRAARRRDLGAGHARHVPLAEHPARLHAGRDEQGALLAEPRLLAHAAPLVHRARDRHRRQRARPRPGRGAQAQLHPRRRDAVHDAERLRLRLGRLRGHARPRARAGRATLDGAPPRGREPRPAARRRDRLDARLGHEQLRPVAPDQPRAAVLGQQRGRDGEARHLRRDRRHARHDAAGPGARDRHLAGRRRHPRLRPGLGDRAHRPRLVLELARRLLGHLREPVRRHRPQRREGCDRGARGRHPPARRGRAAARTARTTSCSRAASRSGADNPEAALPFFAVGAIINANNAAIPEQLRDITLNKRYVYVPPFELPDLERKYGNLTLTYADAGARRRRRGRPGDGRLRARRLRGRRRLRHADPPADRGGPGHGRSRARHRRGDARDVHLRRRGQPADARTSTTTTCRTRWTCRR